MSDNIFKTIKQTVSKHDFIEFVKSIYGVEFKGTNAFCPLHDHGHNTPSFGINSDSGGAFFKCFACGASGDITKFVELKEHISPLQAAKKVCDHFGIPNTINAKEMSEEEKAAYEAHQAILKAENEARMKKEAEQRAKKELALKARLAKTAPQLVENKLKNYDLIKDQISAIFPIPGKNFDPYSRELIGYSFEHKSLAIIIRDAKGTPVNIKYREKFAYDASKGELTSERMPGKWIGESGAHASPFPLNFYNDYQGSTIVICEGEKDALNLMCFNTCALTLGGVTASWQEYKELLRDKHVFIWFDHDEAGYENAIKKFYEIKDVARSVRIVLFYMVGKNLSKGYDISDYLHDNAFKFQSASPLETVAFSCFEPTNIIIDEICEYFPELSEKLERYKTKKIVKHFDEIFREILAQDEDGNYVNIFNVKGELDEEYIQAILKQAKELKKKFGEKYDRFKKSYFEGFLLEDGEKGDFDKFSEVWDKLLYINKTVLTNYHQTHITDMTESFRKSLDKLGYKTAQYHGELYFWTKTHYAKLDLSTLSYFIQEHWMNKACVDKKKASAKNAKEIIDNILNTARPLDFVRRDDARRIVNFKNGTLFISKNGVRTFKPMHDPRDATLNILEFNYDKSAKCHKWHNFLRQVLPDEDDRKTLMEFIGYCFLPSHDFESFLFLYGKSGANGKSVILSVIRDFFGAENVSSLQLQQFEGHQTHALVGKFLNIGAEIDKNGTDKGQLSVLKTLVSAKDEVSINPKGETPFSLPPSEKPKLAFAGNEKPKQNLDNGFFRRMLVLTFDTEIQDDRKIRNLSDRFADEMSGIFSLAMEGLDRLIVQGKFTKSKRMLGEIEEYKDEVNPMRTFVKDAIVADTNWLVPNTYLYQVYKSYVEGKGGVAMKEQKFFGTLKEELLLKNIVVTKGQKRLSTIYTGITSNKPYCTFGIKLSDANLDFDSICISGSQVMIEAMNIYQANGAAPDVD
ncbi:phage/plasmid primase, P4 family [Campylobacter concisus]|uniref:phage/plasmid primase, P4 family n=1 Tax=Campylobacter concisus TaxID=199 RepID=UPI0015E16E99|nr:phage/plasmid primase, P4 family [Campylobacter concisus]